MAEENELRRLARGGTGGLFAALVSGLGGLAFIAVGTNFYSRSDVGTVFTLTSLFLVALAVVTLGADVGIVRFVALKLVGGRPTDTAGVLAVTLAPTVLLSCVVALATWLAAPSMSNLAEPAALRLLAVTLPVATVSNLIMAATRGMGTVRPTLMVESLLRQGLQPILALACALAAMSSTWLLAAWTVPYLIAGAAGARSYSRLAANRGVRSWVAPWNPVVRPLWGEVWRFNGPRALTQVAQLSIRRADIPLVAWLAGRDAAAVYTAASRFVAAGLQAIRGVQQMVGPQLARLMAGSRVDEAASTLRTATSWNVLIAWPIYLACGGFPLLVLSLFGPGYESGRIVVIILSLGMLVGVAAGPVDIALLMLGRSGLSLANNLIALAVNLGLNLALIPVWGINGAAVAWATAIFISNALPTIQIRPILGPASDRRTLMAMAVTTTAFLVTPTPLRLTPLGDTVIGQIAILLGAVMVYLGLLYVLRRQLLLGPLVHGVLGRLGRGRGPGQAPA